MTARWAPAFGAHLEPGGATVRVCAPAATRVRVCLAGRTPVTLTAGDGGVFSGAIEGAAAGDRYTLQIDDHSEWPDPWSRWQPEGVHRPSMLIDPTRFAWTDGDWRGVPRERLVIYELHVGTFTPEGTFTAAAARLPALAALGVTAVELMPVAAFPGARNWGYDGAAWFAPSERYGHPDDLRALVDVAHGLGLAVLLDVVYNHLGPDGAYLAAVMPTVFTDRHHTPWGRAINLDGPGSAAVRRVICDNALHWLLEYHLDGVRLDATHALIDDSPEHLLAQLAREVETHVIGRTVHLIAEDERNLDTLLLPRHLGGAGLTGVWADDFHHAIRRYLAGDHEAWFTDFAGSTSEIARAVAAGWVFSGQSTTHFRGPRGTSPEALPIEAHVICLQNHDQVGNRAHGERLHHQIDMARWLAATTLLLTAPETPLLFMGQEWAASAPFLYFTDHQDALGALVVEGRRNEFGRFSAFADVGTRDQIPNPQAEATFRASVLDWTERQQPPHAGVLAETRALLAIRHAHLTAAPRPRSTIRAYAPDDSLVLVAQPSDASGVLVTCVDLGGSGSRVLDLADRRLAPVLHDVLPPAEASGGGTAVHAAARTTARVLHATRRAADARLEGHQLHLDAPAEPFGLVLHLTGASS
jgi:maltooligosyltrehalose trehalohydrolase